MTCRKCQKPIDINEASIGSCFDCTQKELAEAQLSPEFLRSVDRLLATSAPAPASRGFGLLVLVVLSIVGATISTGLFVLEVRPVAAAAAAAAVATALTAICASIAKL